jgi:hypothetical protein
MFRLAISAVLLFSLWQGVPQKQQSHPHDPNSQTAKITTNKNEKSVPAPQPKEEGAQTQIFNYEAQNEQKQAESQSGVNILGLHVTSDWAMAVLTLVLVVLTLAYVVVAYWQVQTSHDTERAWISARPAVLSPQLQALWEQGDPLPALPAWVHLFPVRFQNTGNSPAQIDEIVIRYVLLDSLSALRVPPECGQSSPQNGYLLVPRERVVFSVALTAGTELGTLRAWQVANVQNGVSFLYGYGFVRYRDVYRRSHITCFGYVYNFPQGGAINFEQAEFRRGGPPTYNKAT